MAIYSKGLHLLCSVIFALAANSAALAKSSSSATTDNMGSVTSVSLAKNEQNRKFAQDLCFAVHHARNMSGEDIPTLIKNEFAKHLGINVTDPDYQTKVTQFWNTNQNDFICLGKINTQYRESEHLLKRMINLGEDSNFFYRFLLKDKQVDVNAVEYVDGEPETIIDFIDKILLTPEMQRYYSVKELQKLRKNLIKHFGAKKAVDL
ncbi:hypothetical protein [Rheinheimera baltica]|uniref:hypothetical protein n=1 Tax=Rheinheimera baltica TaxID=67576 RepID=UPI000488A00C|nr:hypothetical protein [Rheinheimera baltica]